MQNGLVVLAMVGLIHLLTHFLTEFDGKTDEQIEILKKIKVVTFEMPGEMDRTLYEIMTGYGLTWSILLVFLAINVLFARPSKPLFWLSGLACLASGIIMLQYLIIAPAAMLILAACSYTLAGIQFKDHS